MMSQPIVANTIEVPYLTASAIEADAQSLLDDFSGKFYQLTKPPIPVDEIGITRQKIGTDLFDAIIVGTDKGIAKNKAGAFVSFDRGVKWERLSGIGGLPDGPVSDDPDRDAGLHPGGQGLTNFSFIASPRNQDVLYVGGDRQPTAPDVKSQRRNIDGWSSRRGFLFLQCDKCESCLAGVGRRQKQFG